jgi:hypothetical protein
VDGLWKAADMSVVVSASTVVLADAMDVRRYAAYPAFIT